MALTERKAFGAFYTPHDAAHYMASWAMRAADEVILEPSVGDGSFLAAAHDVARGRGWARPRFVASEIDRRAAADVIARGLVTSEELALGDFLNSPVRKVDAAIGNPPYVRLRALPLAQAQEALRTSTQDLGAAMLTSGSVWMPFVARATRFLRPGGRLALVLPWDFTYVRYARPLWQHLAEKFGSLRAVRVRDRIFRDISQDVLLLFAEDKGRTTSSITFEAHRTVGDLIEGKPEAVSSISVARVVAGDRAFQEALLPSDVLGVLEATRGLTVQARDLVKFNIGYVSGDKDFFHPTRDAKLPPDSLLPALTDARALRRAGLHTSELADDAASLLWLPDGELTSDEQRYVDRGAELGVHRRYKCRTRQPWYIVPGVKAPDLVLSVFAHRPVLMVNDAEYVASNSLLCGYLRAGTAESFAAGWYNSLTLLYAELEVHSLGGGVLVLVPNEAGNIRVLKTDVAPLPALQKAAQAIRAGNLDAAYQAGDSALSSLLGPSALELIRSGIRSLEEWRLARPTN